MSARRCTAMVLRAADPAASCGGTLKFGLAKSEKSPHCESCYKQRGGGKLDGASSPRDRGGCIDERGLVSAADPLAQDDSAIQQLGEQVDALLTGP